MGTIESTRPSGTLKIFVLEDDPNRIIWFRKTFNGCEVHTTKYLDEARRLVSSQTYDRLYLDHDLGDWDETDKGYMPPAHELGSGYDFAQWLANRPDLQHEATVIIHSVNPGGAERMWQTLMTSRDVAVIPFPILAKTERGLQN